MNYQTPERRRALAADYAIGLMPPTARKRFEHLLQDDAPLRAELARWNTHLSQLTEPLLEQPVPDHVWQAIVARIEPQTLHVPARRPFWSWVRLSALACSLLIALTVGLLYNRDSVQYKATLLSGTAQPGLSIEAHSDYLAVRPLELAAVDGGRSLELWAIPVEGKPVSLGLIPRDGDGRITLSQTQQQLIRIPVVLAVSLEPQGGSPTGQPTGPVLYQGPLASL
ncbi:MULTISPECIES: anti-sigma factor [Pseudomonas]|jgi:anti-sigma-K factor RskA|uniref:Anti-sigma factor n=1 Tax=Pseudomonas fragi TaxID=296 RepID=A0A9Q5AXK3_PSEFR|nr:MULTISPECIES: anti-sigma factor [Pseudomonas]AOA07844.1 anti-sigma factor [Pseudomonas sp. TMW 2.1634]ARQ72983.1 anti-sigma factor [Pseudomonas fragi]ASC87557.1 anti-sigma factor [Pseudomonas fragi]MBM1200087.1 anti-sigma factor [Pseudomonas fragi]NNB00572.1 anti-sigma factor [Pseudomonas fragi]